MGFLQRSRSRRALRRNESYGSPLGGRNQTPVDCDSVATASESSVHHYRSDDPPTQDLPSPSQQSQPDRNAFPGPHQHLRNPPQQQSGDADGSKILFPTRTPGFSAIRSRSNTEGAKDTTTLPETSPLPRRETGLTTSSCDTPPASAGSASTWANTGVAVGGRVPPNRGRIGQLRRTEPSPPTATQPKLSPPNWQGKEATERPGLTRQESTAWRSLFGRRALNKSAKETPVGKPLQRSMKSFRKPREASRLADHDNMSEASSRAGAPTYSSHISGGLAYREARAKADRGPPNTPESVAADKRVRGKRAPVMRPERSANQQSTTSSSLSRESAESASAHPPRNDSLMSVEDSSIPKWRKGSLTATPLLDLKLPDLTMERYSVMFESVLSDKPELRPSLFERRHSRLGVKTPGPKLEAPASVSPPLPCLLRSFTSPLPPTKVCEPALAQTEMAGRGLRGGDEHGHEEGMAGSSPMRRANTAPVTVLTNTLPTTGQTSSGRNFVPPLSACLEDSLPSTPATSVLPRSPVTPHISQRELFARAAAPKAYALGPLSSNPPFSMTAKEVPEQEVNVQVEIARQFSVIRARKGVEHVTKTKQPQRPKIVELKGRR